MLTLALPMRRAHVVDVEAIGGERARVDLHAHRGPWPPLMVTSPTPGCCEIFCASRVSAQILDLDQRQGLRRDRERQDRRVGGIDLGVDRRRRQILPAKDCCAALIAACTSCSATSS